MIPKSRGAFALRAGILLFLTGSLGLSRMASAHEADDRHEHEGRLRADTDRQQTPRYGAFEFRLGPYRPRVDSEFNGATPYEDAFGNRRSLSFGLQADWQALRIPHFGSLGPGVGVHWFQRKGTAPFTNPTTEEKSAHPDRLWIVPAYAVLVLRVDVLKTDLRIPVVPYVKGGFAMALWEARDAKKVSVQDGEKGRGLETGLQFQVGAMFHLNPLMPQAALDMDAGSGVNDAYLFAEWWVSDIDSFDQGMQVGTNTWTFGLAIEF